MTKKEERGCFLVKYAYIYLYEKFNISVPERKEKVSMEHALKWHRRVLPLAVLIALLGAVGIYLDFSLQFAGRGGAAYTGNYEGLTGQLLTVIGVSGALILLNLVLLAFGLKLGGGRKVLMGYAVTSCVMLAVQIVIYYMAMNGVVNEMTDGHTRRMYLGYLACIGTPFVLSKVKEAIQTGGRAYGQSLADRR